MTESQTPYNGKDFEGDETDILNQAMHYRRLAELYKELCRNRGDQLAIADTLQSENAKDFYPKQYNELLSLQQQEREINSRINQEK